ncbi:MULTISPECIES: PAS domain S-box protein [Salinibaculum]|uniref:PAS domain S-box protein n=1 Tax=Salinibaculum TaxID=2732368 RepID=UPI0030D0D25B
MTESIRILHVDDDPAFGDMAAEFLEREDERFDVTTATDASEGLERLGDAVDCVVSDYDMPGPTGIDFLETVRETRPELPFVLFTGKGSEEVASEAVSAGVTDYLQKERGTGQYTVLANSIANAVEQYRSKRELEASQRRLSLFIEQSPLGVLEYDENFEIVGLNEAGQDILGYSESDLRGETWETLVASSSYENVDEVTSALAEAEGGYHSVDENVRKDGEHITCEWHNRVVTDDEGEVVAVFSLFQDITERIERERRLERTSARLEALFENSPDMINVHDTDGNILDPNPRFREKTGYDAGELADMKVWDVDQQLDRDEAADVWAEMDAGERLRLESVYRTRDGETFPVELHVRRLNLAGEDRFVVISRDVSERRERERDLERYREYTDRMLDAIDDLFFIYDAEGTPQRWNESFADVTGYPDAEIPSLNAVDFVPDDYREAAAENFEAVLETGHARLEAPVLAADGSTTPYEFVANRVEHPDGRPQVVGIGRDVTVRRERERDLERQNRRLEEFASVVSHDLRSPLSVAEGNLELARENRDSDELQSVARAHDRIRSLIEDVLTLAREGNPVETVEPVGLAETAETCWKTVETGDATLAVETQSTVLADRSRLRRMFENLVQNSVDHGGPGVTVTVGDVEGGFCVADDGPGIPPEKRSEVFERGYSTSEDGTGFGLRIVEQLADAHDWEVSVAASDAGGARVEFTGVTFVDR